MLRMIAYGTELNLAHPARPTDPKIAYEPEWALKVRVKSVTFTMLGMPAMDDGGPMATTVQPRSMKGDRRRRRPPPRSRRRKRSSA